MNVVHIRLFSKFDGKYEDLGSPYVSSDFATIPTVGDMIVSPFVTDGADRRKPENREVLEVIERWHPVSKTQSEKTPYIILVVSARIGTFEEVDILRD